MPYTTTSTTSKTFLYDILFGPNALSNLPNSCPIFVVTIHDLQLYPLQLAVRRIDYFLQLCIIVPKFSDPC